MMTGLFAFPRPRRGASAVRDDAPDTALQATMPAGTMPAGTMPAASDWQTDLDDVFYGLVAERRSGRWWRRTEVLLPGPRRPG